MGILESIWGYLVAGVAVIIWLIRLEGSSKANTTAIEAQGEKHDEAMHRLADQRREDLETARHSRQEVTNALTGIQADIKAILEKVGSR